MALAIVVLTAAVGSVAAAAPPAASGPSAGAKKRCKIVKKRVHGKIRKVRVCTKPAQTVKSVSLKLDTAHSVSLAIKAADGGTISATAAGGAKLTLTIPKDALLTDKTVTLTPIVSLGGLPKGSRFLGGAQLAPEGTGLGKNATLTVEISAAASAKHLHAIGWTGTGKTPFTYAAARTGSAVRIKVGHFSGYGVEDGSTIPPTGLEVYLRGQYPRVHQQLVEATTTDSVALGRQAMYSWLSWEASAEYAPDAFMGEERQEMEDVLVPKVIKNAIEKSYERCKQRHDVADEVLLLTGLQRQAQLLGLNALNALIEQRRGQCATFELDFESVISGVAGGGHATAGVRVHALKLSFANDYENEAPLDYYRFEWLPEVQTECSITTVTRGEEPFRAKLSSVGEGDDPPGVNVGDPHIVMHVFGGTTSETITVTCPNSAPLTFTLPFFGGMFRVFHHDQSDPYPLLIDDWEYVGTSLFARKTYSQSISVEGGTVTEQTSFELRHTPE